MKIRKYAALIGAVTLSMGALGACSSNDSGSTDATDSAGADTSGDAAGDSTDAAGDSSPAAGSDEAGNLTVFAAASLSNAFPDIAADVFAADYPNVEVTFSFDGSSSLVEQINAGAPVDVFASADENNMEKAGDLAADPQEFTKNTLRLIVPKGNPAGITGLEDLDGTNFVICAPQVPCGRVTGELAQAQGVTFNPVSEEQSVTDVRTKVETGEADAGLVYITDAMAASDKVDIVDVAGIEDVGTSYMISTLTDAASPELAQAFVDAVISAEGQEILATYGFGTGSGQ